MNQLDQAATRLAAFGQLVTQTMIAMHQGDGSPLQQITPAIAMHQIIEAARALLLERDPAAFAGQTHFRVAAKSLDVLQQFVAQLEAPLRTLRVLGPIQAGGEYVGYVVVQGDALARLVALTQLNEDATVRDVTVFGGA